VFDRRGDPALQASAPEAIATQPEGLQPLGRG
jgi:hypothetical protein